MTPALPRLLDDLADETAVLDDLLTGLSTEDWDQPTPAKGWLVRDQVSHLAYFDGTAMMSATEPERFRVESARLLELGMAFPDRVAEQHHELPVPELLGWFRAARRELIEAFGGLDGKTRVPWYGPDMSVLSSATARLMETWAHGQDVFDAFGWHRPATVRLRHIAHLGVRTFGFSFQLRGLPLPTEQVRVELTSPDGELWAWGMPEAANLVRGPAEDFCLLVTQRRHLADTELVVSGAVATEWLSIAQVFAGAPTDGRAPGEFREPAGENG